MNIAGFCKTDLLEELSSRKSDSIDFAILATGAFSGKKQSITHDLLREAARVLREGGVLFVQGIPESLPDMGVFLDKFLTFKYWFAVESIPLHNRKLPSVHGAVMLFVKGGGRFNIKQVRLPHKICRACGKNLKDWGGKAHLMHPDGYVISDVIKDIPPADNYSGISKPLYKLLIDMLDFPSGADGSAGGILTAGFSPPVGIVGPIESVEIETDHVADEPQLYFLPDLIDNSRKDLEWSKPKSATPAINSKNLYNVIHLGDSIEILKQYPDESADLVFADPPYNLAKEYSAYDDGQADRKYIDWCNDWLAEYARILKPTGSLFVLNLPKWAIHHASFLNRRLYFQNWIVWDALSEPRGKIMPAHYSLLFYTKSRSDFTFNYQEMRLIDSRDYCIRASCVKSRKESNNDKKSEMNDIWWDVHRIKHKRDRDYHPCQLPESLMERIIRLTTNPGDIVLDAFGGVGTTPITALKMSRRYVAIDIDPNYVRIMREKIRQVEKSGRVQRNSVKKETRKISKKELQLELGRLAMELGRLPNQKDVERKCKYDVKLFLETFETWGKALKAAKLEMHKQCKPAN